MESSENDEPLIDPTFMQTVTEALESPTRYYALPAQAEAHMVDFVLQDHRMLQQNIIWSQIFPAERLAHTDNNFYNRALQAAYSNLNRLEPYASMQRAGIQYSFECIHIAYMVEPIPTIPTQRPTPYYFFFQIPLGLAEISNMPYPLIIATSRGPQTRMKITLKISIPDVFQQSTVPDVFDQLIPISDLMSTVNRLETENTTIADSREKEAGQETQELINSAQLIPINQTQPPTASTAITLHFTHQSPRNLDQQPQPGPSQPNQTKHNRILTRKSRLPAAKRAYIKRFLARKREQMQ